MQPGVRVVTDTRAGGLGVDYVATMAAYNAWMNDKLYAAAARLPADEVMRARGAFFGSIFGTLGHLVVADTIWLKRFAADPAHLAALAELESWPMPTRVDRPPCNDLAALATRRRTLDALILRWTSMLDERALSRAIPYANLRGDRFSRPLLALLMHVFNHQTHHRGQATTLLTQAGEDVGATDLVAMPPPA